MSSSPQTEHTLPKIALIVAMTMDRVIGAGSRLPWHLPEDLQLFKTLTTGNTVIMGRKTFTSIGKPLPGRHNIVLSRKEKMFAGVEFCTNLLESLAAAAKHGKPVFIIGGSEVYEKALPIASEIHISWIEKTHQGDVYFPEFDLSEWLVVEERAYSGFTYTHYHRK